MQFIRLSDLSYMTASEIIASHSDQSFPIPFELPEGYADVTEVIAPKYNKANEFLTLCTPTQQEDGSWLMVWRVDPMLEEQKQGLLEKLKPLLLEGVTNKRWEVETGGITLPNGVKIATGTMDQNRIGTTINTSERARIKAVKFKSQSGWVDISIDYLKVIESAIAFHVQACFAAECAHHQTIQAMTTLEEAAYYDINTGWPI